MDLRHKIDNEYNTDPRHLKQWDMTIEWLKQFDIKGICLDCGDRTELTIMIECLVIDNAMEFAECNTSALPIRTRDILRDNIVHNTTHDLNSWQPSAAKYDNVFIFEVLEHLLNPLLLLYWLDERLKPNGFIYVSTPINRPNWIRNRVRHFHEFNYNELMHLIDKAGFKVVDEKIINPSVKWWTGFRPIMRKFFGCGNNILLRLKRK